MEHRGTDDNIGLSPLPAIVSIVEGEKKNFLKDKCDCDDACCPPPTQNAETLLVTTNFITQL